MKSEYTIEYTITNLKLSRLMRDSGVSLFFLCDFGKDNKYSKKTPSWCRDFKSTKLYNNIIK